MTKNILKTSISIIAAGAVIAVSGGCIAVGPRPVGVHPQPVHVPVVRFSILNIFGWGHHRSHHRSSHHKSAPVHQGRPNNNRAMAKPGGGPGPVVHP